MTREELECVDSYYLIAYDSQGQLMDIEKLDGRLVNVNSVGSFIHQVLCLGKILIDKQNLN